MHMAESGWKAFGSELSQIAVDYVNNKCGKEVVLYGDIPDLQFDKHSFDAINMTNVLEHVPSPTKTLLDCKALLSSNAFLFVRVPNMDSSIPFSKIYKVLNFFGFRFAYFSVIATSPPTHLNGFTTRTLKKIFDKTGYEVVEIKTSKLRNNKFYSIIEVLSNIIFYISFKQINISPTILAIVRPKNI
jgi:2-polyprenyl-3-methyl-5-hydroxy-6-metoxy-1,4-benzoquinol methylase